MEVNAKSITVLRGSDSRMAMQTSSLSFFSADMHCKGEAEQRRGHGQQPKGKITGSPNGHGCDSGQLRKNEHFVGVGVSQSLACGHAGRAHLVQIPDSAIGREAG